MKYNFLFTATIMLFGFNSLSQPKGKLFIIGGGHRSIQLIQTLLSTSQLSAKDYIAVLPMASQEPDTAYYYIKIQLEKACSNTIANLNFTQKDTSNTKWLDSLQQAKLIFITGGDQSRFMNVVLGTSIHQAILNAFNNGATIAGTSAGAAVMSGHMITGNHFIGDTAYYETFTELRGNNIEMKDGLGLLASAIVDQHFIARSRYNRLLSALAKYPHLSCIGIDEAAAIIVSGKNVHVTGDGQVIVFSNPQNVRTTPQGFIKFDDVRMSIYTNGDGFQLR